MDWKDQSLNCPGFGAGCSNLVFQPPPPGLLFHNTKAGRNTPYPSQIKGGISIVKSSFFSGIGADSKAKIRIAVVSDKIQDSCLNELLVIQMRENAVGCNKNLVVDVFPDDIGLTLHILNGNM